MPQISIGDTSLYYESQGPATREAIVFSPGLLWNTSLFASQVETLKAHYRCVSYDHRGQGRSAPSPQRAIDMEVVYRDAAALIEALGLAPVHFCGVSMGGFVGLRLAARRPDLIRSLILLDTTARPERPERVRQYRKLNLVSRWIGHWAVAGRVLPILFAASVLADPARREDRKRWRRMLVRSRRDLWRAVNGVIERDGVEAEIGRIAAPTLVMVGDQDVATPPAEAEHIAAAIPGARLIRIPEAGHSAPVEQPALVTREIKRFLTDIA
ncbi:MAG: alpha/beta fold hydrolase [Azospirillum sp.]|nr:alpha/beta fold hydrolase [Azospirillum sp.]